MPWHLHWSVLGEDCRYPWWPRRTRYVFETRPVPQFTYSASFEKLHWHILIRRGILMKWRTTSYRWCSSKGARVINSKLNFLLTHAWIFHCVLAKLVTVPDCLWDASIGMSIVLSANMMSNSDAVLKKSTSVHEMHLKWGRRLSTLRWVRHQNLAVEEGSSTFNQAHDRVQ